MNETSAMRARARSPSALTLAPLALLALLAVAPTAKADPPHAPDDPTPSDATVVEPPASSDVPAAEPDASTDAAVPVPPATDTGTATAPALQVGSASSREQTNAFGRGILWAGTVTEVSLLASIVLEVGVLPPLSDNGPRLLLLMGASVGLGVGVGVLAAQLNWPVQATLAVHGAPWGAFVLAPFGMLIDGAGSRTTDGLDVGPYTAAMALIGAAAGGVLAPLLLDVEENDGMAFFGGPPLGMAVGVVVWLALWIFGAIADDPVTSSRALVASAGIGGTLGLTVPFIVRAVRAANE